MVKLTLTIDSEDDAIVSDPRGELFRILGELADDILSGDNPVAVFDANGNRIGTVCVDAGDES